MSKEKETERSDEPRKMLVKDIQGMNRSQFIGVLLAMVKDSGRDMALFMVKWNQPMVDRTQMADELNQAMFQPSEILALVTCILHEMSVADPKDNDFHGMFVRGLEMKAQINKEADAVMKHKENSNEH